MKKIFSILTLITICNIGLSQSVITLATGLSNPNSIKADNSFIYWIEYGSGTVKKISSNGGTVIILVSGLYSPVGLSCDNTDLYFGENYGTNSARIKKVSKSGGTVTTIVGNAGSVGKISLDNLYIYFSDDYGNKIQKVSKSGGSVTTLSDLTYSPSGITTDENYIYWTEFTNPGTVKKILKTGGTTIIMGNNSNSLGIDVDNNFCYWTENVFSNQGKVNKVALNGGNVIQLVSNLNYAWDLCIDNLNVYWIENLVNGSVKQVSKNGGTVKIISANSNEPVSITSDDLYLYWLERNGGSDGKLKKANKIISNVVTLYDVNPSEYYLSQNFPNPFNPSTKIKFSIPENNQSVRLKVFDNSGKKVSELINEKLSAGVYETEFDGSNVSSGVYYYKLETNDFVETKKMILIR